MANLILTDVDNNVYNFPDTFWFSGTGIDANINTVNRTYADGGRNIAGGFLNGGAISITGTIQGDTQAEFETKKRAFYQAILNGGNLSISNDTVSRYVTVIYSGDSPETEEGQQFQTVTVDFIAEDTLWVDTVATTDSNVVAGNDTFTVDATGSDRVIQPVIEIEADQSVDIPSVKITNKSDGGMSFIYNDANFQSGDILRIDTEAGTVKLNNGNTINNMISPARFLRLQPGINTIDYEGAACTIRFIFRKNYR